MTAQEAFERGIHAVKSHDTEAFAFMVAEDVIFDAPRGMPRSVHLYPLPLSSNSHAC